MTGPSRALWWALATLATAAVTVGVGAGMASAGTVGDRGADDADADADGDGAPTDSATPTYGARDADAVVNPYTGAFAQVGGPPVPAIVGSGADALLQAPDLRGDNAPTLLERYGTQGYTLDQPGRLGTDTDRALNAIANGVFAIASWMALAVVAVIQWAFTVELFSFVGDAVGGVVGALRGTVYTPFVATAVVLAGGWAAWHGLVRGRGTLAVEGIVWTVVALATAALFFAAPGALLDGANTVSTEISRASLAAMSTVDIGTGSADELTDAPTFEGPAADQQLRRAGDRFWRVFVHQPWLVLHFGDPQVGARYGERLLDAKTVTPTELDDAGGDVEAHAALTADKQQAYLALQEEVVAQPRAAEWFRGERTVERVGLASLTLVGVALGGVLMAVVAVALLLTQMALLLLALLAPLALLVGIHPGAGRLLAIRWAELALGLFLKRIALGVLLAVVLVVNGVLLDAARDLGWLVGMGLQTLVVAAAVLYRRPLLRLAGPTTVPVLHAGDRTGEPARDRPAPRVSLGPFTIRHRTPSGPRSHAGGAPAPPPPAGPAQGADLLPATSPPSSHRVRRSSTPEGNGAGGHGPTPTPDPEGR